MSQFISHSEWEHFFTEEALTVEEMLSSGNFLQFDQSKLRIALENQLLEWTKFKNWILEKIECPCIKNQISTEEIAILKNKHLENKKTFAHYDIWSNDLIPLETWDNSLIVLGLYPNENLVAIPNVIFILCPPFILNQILELDQTSESDLEIIENSSSISLLNIDPSLKAAPDLNFSKISVSQSDLENKSEQKISSPEPSFNEEFTGTAYSIWSLVNSKHTKSSEIARKQFDAYVVLKIYSEQTHFFKMDEDLEKEELNTALFNYDLRLPNAFTKVLKSGVTESFALENLGLNILDFKYACISPLKLGQQTLGFLLGLKIEKTTKLDEQTLENISNENAA